MQRGNLQEPKKVLVTGAAGFVGPHVVRALGKAGHKVFAIDRKGVPIYTLPTSQIRSCDVADARRVDKVIGDIRPDAIIHLAGWSHVGRSWDAAAEVFQANVVGTLNVYEAASRHMKGGGCRFLFVSSADVYGNVPEDQMPLNEQSPVHPDSPYAISKQTAEASLRLLRERSDVELLIVRPFNHIGPGQSPTFAAPSFARQIAEMEHGQREILTHGNLVSKRDFLDVRDVAQAYRLMLEKGRDGDLYVLASGRSVSIEQIVKKLFRIAGMKPRMTQDPALFRPHDTRELRGSSELLRKNLGWKPAHSLDQTLRDILEEARARLLRAPA